MMRIISFRKWWRRWLTGRRLKRFKSFRMPHIRNIGLSMSVDDIWSENTEDS